MGYASLSFIHGGHVSWTMLRRVTSHLLPCSSSYPSAARILTRIVLWPRVVSLCSSDTAVDVLGMSIADF